MKRKGIPEKEVCPRCHGTGRKYGRMGRVSKIDETLLRSLHAEGLSRPEIGKRMGISRQLLDYTLKRMGLMVGLSNERTKP